MDEPIIQPVGEPVEVSRANERIRQLSEKVELTAKERDEKDKTLKEQGDKIASLEKENTFNSSFADILGSQPAAKDHKDEIKAKVLAGYTPEDAAYAVLGKAGKLGTQAIAAPQVAGGSATTNVQTGGQKTIKEMSTAEKRAELEKSIVWT